MTNKLIIAILYSIRSQIEALIYLYEQKEKNDDLNEIDIENQCNHPKKFRKDMTTFGGAEKWICQLCGYEYNEEKQEQDEEE